MAQCLGQEGPKANMKKGGEGGRGISRKIRQSDLVSTVGYMGQYCNLIIQEYIYFLNRCHIKVFSQHSVLMSAITM